MPLAFGDGVAVHDATENVDENGLDRWIAQDDFKCGLHLLLRGSTADIEKVGRIAAVVFDGIHGGHREAGAIDEAGDVAVELDVVQVELAGFNLQRILLGEVAHLSDVRVAEHGVGIDGHLGV